jgi:hypothetical protein
MAGVFAGCFFHKGAAIARDSCSVWKCSQKRLFKVVQINRLLNEKKRVNPLDFSILAYLCSPN